MIFFPQKWAFHPYNMATVQQLTHQVWHICKADVFKTEWGAGSTEWRELQFQWSQCSGAPLTQISEVNYLKIFTYVIHHFHHHFPVNDQWGLWSWQKGLKWSNKFHFLSVSMLPWLMPDSLRAESKSCYTSTLPWRELLYHTVSSRERGRHGEEAYEFIFCTLL